MTRREGFEKMVKRPRKGYVSKLLNEDEAMSVLEVYHRRMVRMVKKYQQRNVHGALPRFKNKPVAGYYTALHDILAALATLRQGGPR